MTIFDILRRLNEADEVRFQMLQPAMTDARLRKGGGTEVSFMTDEINPNSFVNDSGPVGLVIWVPREWFDEERITAEVPLAYRCPDCGYTHEDAAIHGDHSICEAKGGPPMPTQEPAKEEPREANVTDLMTALRDSVEAAKKKRGSK